MVRREKKRVLPLVMLTLLLWGALVAMVVWVDPAVIKDWPWQSVYFIFFLVWWLAWFFGLTLVLNNTRRGGLYALATTGVLMLRLIRLGNIVNVMLLVGLIVVIDFYFSNR